MNDLNGRTNVRIDTQNTNTILLHASVAEELGYTCNGSQDWVTIPTEALTLPTLAPKDYFPTEGQQVDLDCMFKGPNGNIGQYHLTLRKADHQYEGVLTPLADKEALIAQEKLLRRQLFLEQAVRLLTTYHASQQKLLSSALHQILQLLESKIGYIYRYQEKTKTFTLVAWSKDVMKECEIAQPETCYFLDNTGIWGEAVRQRKPIIINDFAASHPLKRGYPEGHVKLEKFMTIPVIQGEDIVAVVGVANRSTPYQDQDVQWLTEYMDLVWQKHAALAIESQSNRYLDIIEQTPASIVITNTKGDIEYVNRYFEDVTGYSREEAIGKNPNVLRSGIQTTSYYQNLWETISAGRTWHGEFANKKKDGTIYWEQAIIAPVKNENGVITHYVAIKDDITSLKAAKKDIAAYTHTFQQMLNSSDMEIWSVDKSYRLVFFNEKWRNAFFLFFGVEVKEGLCITEEPLLPEMVRHTWKGYYDKAFAGEIVEQLDSYTHPGTGEEKYIRIKVFPLTNEVGSISGASVFVTDITDEVAKNQALIISENRYRQLADNTSDAVSITSVDNTFIYLSPSIINITGHTPEEYKRFDALDNVHPEDQHLIKAAVEAMAQGQKHTRTEYRVRHKKGHYIWVETKASAILDASGAIKEIISSSTDITARKKAQLELEVNEKHLRQLTEAIEDIVWKADAAGKINYINQNGLNRLYQSKGGLYQDGWVSIIHPDDVQKSLTQWNLAVKQKVSLDIEQRMRIHTGEYRWFRVRAYPAFDSNNELIGFTGLSIDIEAAKASQAAIERERNNLSFLAAAQRELLQVAQENQIYDLITQKLSELLEHKAGIVASAFYDDNYETKAYTLPKSYLQKLIDLTGYDVKGTKGKIIPDTVAPLKEGRILNLGASILELGNGGIPKAIAKAVDTILPKYRIDSIGLVYKNELLGNIHIFSFKHTPPLDHDLIEALVNATAIQLANLRAAETIQSNEKRLQTVINSFGDILYTLDVAQRHTAVFGDWVTAAGGAETYLGKSAKDLFGPEAAKVHEEANLRALEGETVTYQWSIPQQDGNTLWFETKLSPITNEKGTITGILGVGRDITQQEASIRQIKELNLRNKLAREAAQLGVWDWDLVNNDIQWDEGMYQLYDIDPDQFGGAFEAWQQSVHPDDLEKATQQVEDAIAGKESFAAYFRIITPKGQVKVLNAHAQVINDSSGKPVRMVGVNWDITEQKEQENHIQRARRRLIRGQKIAQMGDWELGLDKNWLYWSNNMYPIQKLDKSKGIPKYTDWLQLFAPYSRNEIEIAFAQSIQRQESFDIIIECLATDRVPCYFRMTGEYKDIPGGGKKIVGILIDVTKDKEAEAQQLLLKSAMDNAKDAVLITDADLDKPGPRIVYANKAFTQMTGYQLSEVLGKTPRLLQGEHTDKEELARMRRNLDNNRSGTYDLVNYTKWGEPYWVRMSIAPVYNAEDSVSHFVAVEQDITEEVEKKLQDKLYLRLMSDISRMPTLKVQMEELTDKLTEAFELSYGEFWISRTTNRKILYRIASYLQQEEDRLQIDLNKKLKPISAALSAQKPIIRHINFPKEIPLPHLSSYINLSQSSLIIIPIQSYNTTMGLGIFVIDEQKLAEKKTKDLSDILQRLADTIRRNQIKEELDQFFALSPDVLCIADMDGHFLKVNQALVKILGYSEEELLSMSFLDLLHPDDKAKTQAENDNLKAGTGSNDFENRYLTKDGREVWLSWSSHPFDKKILSLL